MLKPLVVKLYSTAAQHSSTACSHVTVQWGILHIWVARAWDPNTDKQ